MKTVSLNQQDIFLFNTGEAQEAYALLGSHYDAEADAQRFAVWAPNARAVSVVGDFCGWDPSAHPMEPVGGGIWAAYIKGLKNGDIYKYSIVDFYGQSIMKSDPFAFFSEVRPHTGSRVWNTSDFQWTDDEYMTSRTVCYDRPMSIYELHIGSWRGYGGRFPWYRQVADDLAEYATHMGYTHVELMPICEYPLDDSWGYQVTGYYSVNSRYGVPEDLMYLVNKLHSAGVGVILDWVPAHFPKDAHGLARFDGTCLFEHENPLQGEHGEWGTLVYNFGKPEVQSFLVSSAVYFAEEYHIDGLRVDAVTSMLYLNYARSSYIPNRFGGNIDLDAEQLLKKLNSVLHTRYKGFITVAEESTAYANITKPVAMGGLGFDYKWNMGFMHDTLDYMDLDPIYRSGSHNKLTFSMCYAFSERFILPYSHDEVVHCKRSMIEKMNGDYWRKFASLRALYSYMFAHPGKKLMFMGDEFAQFIEWDYGKPLDWFLLEYDKHRQMQDFVSELNALYRAHPALYEMDDSWDGFKWLSVDDSASSVLIFERSSKGGAERIVLAVNFTPVVRYGYRVGMSSGGSLVELMNSDDARFGGSGVINGANVSITEEEFFGFPAYAELVLPPLGAAFFLHTGGDA